MSVTDNTTTIEILDTVDTIEVVDDLNETTPTTPENTTQLPPYLTFLYRVARLHTTPYATTELAGIRYALIPATETFGYGYTEPHISTLTTTNRVAVRRAAGIIATHKNAFTPNNDTTQPPRDLGTAFAALHRKTMGYAPGDRDSNGTPKQTAISMQVNGLPMMPFEAAVTTIALLIERCADHNIKVSIPTLANTLMHWGDGISPDSVTTRRHIVERFYSA